VYASEREARNARLAELDTKKVEELVARMESEMRAAAKELEFERAAALRDEIQQIRLRVLDEDQSAIIARSAELAAQRTPSRSGTRGRGGRGRPGEAPEPVAPALEVSSVTVLAAGAEPTTAPASEAESAQGTPSDWLPGIRDEHEDPPAGRRAGSIARRGIARSRRTSASARARDHRGGADRHRAPAYDRRVSSPIRAVASEAELLEALGPPAADGAR
jgi:hypothetical protein